MRSVNGKQRSIAFDRTKYGPEILIDVAWVHDMPTFIVDAPHSLRFYDIMLVTRGRGTFSLDGSRYDVKPGRVFFTTPGQIRDWNVRDLDGICLFFPETFLAEFFHDALFLQRLPYFHVGADAASMHLAPRPRAALERQLIAMRRELRRHLPDSTHILRARLYEILITLSRAYASQHRVGSSRPVQPLVAAFRDRVERDFRRVHSVAAYARALHVSPGHLSTLCRSYAGVSAKEIIQERTAVEARRLLLHSTDSAEDIAYALGFEDPSYFARFFRRMTGESPRRFRSGQVRTGDSP